jgi:hypothetical protein
MEKSESAPNQETIATLEEAIAATGQSERTFERIMREGMHKMYQSRRSFVAYKNEQTASALIDSIKGFISDLNTMVENVEELKRKHSERSK